MCIFKRGLDCGYSPIEDLDLDRSEREVNSSAPRRASLSIYRGKCVRRRRTGSFCPLQCAFLLQGTLRFRFILLVSLILTFGHETMPFDRPVKLYNFSDSTISQTVVRVCAFFPERVD